jgi:hypothetical protein
MKNVTLSIRNMGSVIIADFTSNIEGKNIAQAVGNALMEAHTHITSQYDKPEVTIAGITLTDAEAKKVKANYWDFQLNFGVVRERLLAQLAFVDAEAGVEYMRRTDGNNVYKNTKSFSAEQIAAQAKEQLRLTKDLTRWVKEDAKASVVPPFVAERRLQIAEARKAAKLLK